MAVVPQFPLGTVLLPTMVLPLHVFEPRYQALVRRVIDGDGEFGVTLIERGSEVGGGDVRAGVGTVARLVEAEPLPGGRWALVAVGVRRFRVVRWLPDDPYPLAEVEDWPDEADLPDADGYRAAVAALRRTLALASELGAPAPPSTVELSDDPAVASFQLATLAPLGPLDKQALLQAPSPRARTERARQALEDLEQILTLRLQLGDQGDDH